MGDPLTIISLLASLAWVAPPEDILCQPRPGAHRRAAPFTKAFLETFFGLGLIVGPTVGGALYQAGGYILPFALIGACLFTSAIFTFLILPQRDSDATAEQKRAPFKIRSVLKNPKVLVAAFSILSASVSIGFLQATLEPHLRQFGLGPIVMGLMFVLSGGVYALTAPCWGWVCENWIHPKLVTAIGGVLICAAFLLIGPAPFIPLDSTLWLCLVSLAIHGLGFGGQVVAAFVDAYKEAVDDGFPDNHDTNAVISGLWTSTFTLGAFIGPSMAGILMDTVGFAWGSVFVVAMHCLVFIGSLIGLCFNKRREEDVEKRPLNISSDSGNYGSSDGSSDGSLRRNST